MKLDLAVAIPGHVPRKSTATMTAQGVLEHSLEYIEAYEDALATSASSDAVIAKMLDRYPGMEHTSALYMSAYLEFREIHKLLFNTRLEKVVSYLPHSLVCWLDDQLFDVAKHAANP